MQKRPWALNSATLCAMPHGRWMQFLWEPFPITKASLTDTPGESGEEWGVPLTDA